jgi:hypothetical protein
MDIDVQLKNQSYIKLSLTGAFEGDYLKTLPISLWYEIPPFKTEEDLKVVDITLNGGPI